MPCATINVSKPKTVLEFSDISAPQQVSENETFEVTCNVTLKSGTSSTYDIHLYVPSGSKAVTMLRSSVHLNVGETKTLKYQLKAGGTQSMKIAIAPSGYDFKDWNLVCKKTFEVV